MGALKQLSIRVEEEVTAMLDVMGITPISKTYKIFHPLLTERFQLFIEREFLQGENHESK